MLLFIVTLSGMSHVTENDFYKNAKMPHKREFEIAAHACEKHSGRVGRTANAKNFNVEMIDLAVEAHIRHKETNYENEFGKG